MSAQSLLILGDILIIGVLNRVELSRLVDGIPLEIQIVA